MITKYCYKKESKKKESKALILLKISRTSEIVKNLNIELLMLSTTFTFLVVEKEERKESKILNYFD